MHNGRGVAEEPGSLQAGVVGPVRSSSVRLGQLLGQAVGYLRAGVVGEGPGAGLKHRGEELLCPPRRRGEPVNEVIII